MEGSKLIVFSTFIGLVAFAFTTIPFTAAIVGGITKDKQNNNDKNIIAILIKAFSWHAIAVIILIMIFSMLDIFLNNIEPNFIKEKCMQAIFWAAEDKNTVMLNASATSGEYQSDGAYSFLLTTYKVIKIFHGVLPLLVFILALYIGYEVNKNKQTNSAFSTLFSLVMYSVVGLFMYSAWIFLADIGMYLPQGENLLSLKNNFWKEIFLN